MHGGEPSASRSTLGPGAARQLAKLSAIRPGTCRLFRARCSLRPPAASFATRSPLRRASRATSPAVLCLPPWTRCPAPSSGLTAGTTRSSVEPFARFFPVTHRSSPRLGVCPSSPQASPHQRARCPSRPRNRRFHSSKGACPSTDSTRPRSRRRRSRPWSSNCWPRRSRPWSSNRWPRRSRPWSSNTRLRKRRRRPSPRCHEPRSRRRRCRSPPSREGSPRSPPLQEAPEKAPARRRRPPVR